MKKKIIEVWLPMLCKRMAKESFWNDVHILHPDGGVELREAIYMSTFIQFCTSVLCISQCVTEGEERKWKGKKKNLILYNNTMISNFSLRDR